MEVYDLPTLPRSVLKDLLEFATKKSPFMFDGQYYKQIDRVSTVAQKGQTQISLPKHKTVSQNTNQFPKTQNSLPKHKSIS